MMWHVVDETGRLAKYRSRSAVFFTEEKAKKALDEIIRKNNRACTS